MLGLCQVSLPCWDLENTETPNQASARALLLFGAPGGRGRRHSRRVAFRPSPSSQKALDTSWDFRHSMFDKLENGMATGSKNGCSCLAHGSVMASSFVSLCLHCASKCLLHTCAKTSSAPLAQMIHCILCSSVSLSLSLSLSRSLSISLSLSLLQGMRDVRNRAPYVQSLSGRGSLFRSRLVVPRMITRVWQTSHSPNQLTHDIT